MPTNNHGGARKGAGRKKKEPTRVLSIRVKNRHYPVIRAAVLENIKKLNDADINRM